ncbi:MAG: hypothetical protein M1815_000903 [Lichina confinis]|nr:MAG: hypothetical protein M1815_000903 [Lichina confinis]
MCSTDCFLGLLAVLFPPLPVWVKRGLCSADSLINIALCVLGGIPGVIHAWYIILKYPDTHDHYQYSCPGDRRDSERGVVTYYFVGQPPSSSPHNRSGQNQHHQQQYTQPQSYGSTTSNNPGQSFSANNDDDAAGPSDPGNDSVPPTYDQAIRGDHKVQSRD